MIFGETRVDDAEGLILAHSLRLPQAMLKKGRVLNDADVRTLKQAGVNFVTGARLEAGDVGEDQAAGIIAKALAGAGITCNSPFTGRCNLFSSRRGLLVYDRDRLDRLNLVDEAVTVATAPAFETVGPRQMVATVKIIPFGVDSRVLDACAAYASTGGEPLISVRPFSPLSTVLISSTLPGLKDKVIEAAAEVTRARVESIGGRVLQEIRCSHDVGAIERALRKAATLGAELILVAGASATVDRRDMVPSAIVKAGGEIDHFGMPADPGNLLLLARLGKIPVVNLPGCARSSKPNGLDWVLARLAAGLAIRSADIMRMGAGGLLKQWGLRPDPITIHPPGSWPREARIAAVIQAAGSPVPVLVSQVESAIANGLEPLVVLSGGDAAEEALPSCEIMSLRDGNLATGLAALPADVDGAMILSPSAGAISPEAVGELVKAFDPDEGRAIILTANRRPEDEWGLIGRDHFGRVGNLGVAEAAAGHNEAVFTIALP